MNRRAFLTVPAAAWIVRAQSNDFPTGLRQGHVMAYDSRRHELLLFGGRYPAEESGEEPLWILAADGTWRKADAAGPRSRSLPAAAYDAERGRFVLYGGISNYSETRFGDRWEWDGEKWQEVSWGRLGPGPRDHHSMAYDSDRKRLVVFGGSVIILQDTSAGDIRTISEVWYDETWEFDGEAWKPFPAVGPGTRAHHCFAYDPVSRMTLLYGGANREQQQNTTTWGWDGSSWRVLSEVGPPARTHSRMALHEPSGQVVLYGGDLGSQVGSDTWTWNGSSWRQRSPATNPGPRMLHAMAYHADLQRLVLFGGSPSASTMDDAWLWDGENWSLLPIMSPTAMQNRGAGKQSR